VEALKGNQRPRQAVEALGKCYGLEQFMPMKLLPNAFGRGNLRQRGYKNVLHEPCGSCKLLIGC